MNAVIYARYSTGRAQKDISIEGQLRECAEFANKKGYDVTGEYIDRRVSGRSEAGREGFRRLMDEAELGLFDIVIVWRLNRFFRNRTESALYRHHLKQHGVKLVSATENIPDGSGGVWIEAILEAEAESYSMRLSEDVSRGMYDTALRAHTTGPKPLGYVTGADKKLVVHPGEARTVQRAFEMYADGATCQEIADTFNSEGITTKTGAAWTGRSFWGMFKNEKYIGIYKYGDDIKIEGGCPAIIDMDTWGRVQARSKLNRKAPGRGKASIDYYLTTKIFCGKCGAAMAGESANKKGLRYYYYACGNKKRRRGCDKKNIPKTEVEDLVLSAAIEALTDENIAYIAMETERAAQKAAGEKSYLRQYQADLKSVEAEIANIGRAIASGIITETTKDLLEDAEGRRRHVRKLIAYEEAIQKTIITAESTAAYLYSFKTGDRKSIEFKKRVFSELVNSVFVYDDKIKLVFNVKKENSREISLKNVSDFTSAGQPK